MNKLDMIKAFARLEDLILIQHEGELKVLTQSSDPVSYNPLTDHALAFKAMVDYSVEVSHEYECVEIMTGKETPTHGDCWVGFDGIDDLPHAIIECILKSKGLWVE